MSPMGQYTIRHEKLRQNGCCFTKLNWSVSKKASSDMCPAGTLHLDLRFDNRYRNDSGEIERSVEADLSALFFALLPELS